jgi:hypothetical protein
MGGEKRLVNALIAVLLATVTLLIVHEVETKRIR